jgi:hypothetical protein
VTLRRVFLTCVSGDNFIYYNYMHKVYCLAPHFNVRQQQYSLLCCHDKNGGGGIVELTKESEFDELQIG